MTQNAEIETRVCRWPIPTFTITVVAADVMTVYMSGEFDLNSNAEANAAFLDGHGRAIVVDMADLDFMDCGGYRAIATARRFAEEHDTSFTVINAHGGPARLLGILDEHGLL